jgi:hypothetical protein
MSAVHDSGVRCQQRQTCWILPQRAGPTSAPKGECLRASKWQPTAVRSRVYAGRHEPSEAKLGVLVEDSSGRLHAHGVAHCFGPWRAVHVLRGLPIAALPEVGSAGQLGASGQRCRRKGSRPRRKRHPESVERGLARATIRPSSRRSGDRAPSGWGAPIRARDVHRVRLAQAFERSGIPGGPEPAVPC